MLQAAARPTQAKVLLTAICMALVMGFWNHAPIASRGITANLVAEAPSEPSPELCTDGSHGIGQCCTWLHCLAGFAAETTPLSLPIRVVLTGATETPAGASHFPDQPDHPPKVVLS